MASPTVADGAVFIGSDTGWFYKLDELTGAVLAKTFLGVQPARTCPGIGVADTATVAVDPRDHRDTVYVAGPNGYLYAFRASNLTLRWLSVIAIPSATTNDYFEWSSPTVTNGKIYIGVASNCDGPLIRGAVIGYDQLTGTKFAEFYAVPTGDRGGSVWSSVAAAPGGDVYVTTGNGPSWAPELSYSESMLKLDPRTLRPLGQFKVPPSQMINDGDFGASPTIFGPYVGACNKNGIFYVLNRSTMRLAWEARIGVPKARHAYAECIAAAAYNGKDLYIAGRATTIRGKSYSGSVQERETTGKLVWETGLPEGVDASPSSDRGGVIAVGTYGDGAARNAVYILSARSGKIIRTLVEGFDFAQATFADGRLFTVNAFGVYAWAS